MAGAGGVSLAFFKLKWWGQKSVTYDDANNAVDRTLAITKDAAVGATGKGLYPGDVKFVADEDELVVTIQGKLDTTPSFNAEENEARLQRVLEVATNNLLSEKACSRPLLPAARPLPFRALATVPRRD